MGREYLENRKKYIVTSAKAMEVKNGSVIVLDGKSDFKSVSTESIVITSGLKAKNLLDDRPEQPGIEYWLIGLCNGTGQIADAIANE